MSIDGQELKKILAYQKTTGVFFWKPRALSIP